MKIDALREHMLLLDTLFVEISDEVSEQYLPLLKAAAARSAEMQAFIEIAAEARPQADQRLSRLDAVIRETVDSVSRNIERAGVDLQDGIAIEELDEFLSRQEQATLALEQARIAATALVVHLDRALKSCSRA